MSAQDGQNDSFLRWALGLAEHCRKVAEGEEELDGRRNYAFVGLGNMLLDFQLPQAEAYELMPVLLGTVFAIFKEVKALPYWIVQACIWQLSEEWVVEWVDQELEGWDSVLVCGVLIVASEPIVEALAAADFEAIPNFGGKILAGLKDAGADLAGLYIEANGLDPNSPLDLGFLVNAHPVECECISCQFRMSVEDLVEARHLPEAYFGQLLLLCNQYADQANADEELMGLVVGQLIEAVNIFLKTELMLGGRVATPDALLAVAEKLFRGWNRWPDFVLHFLTRYPPTMSMDNWAVNSGWVYIGGDTPQIISQESMQAAGGALSRGGQAEDDQIVFGPISANALRAIDSGEQQEEGEN